ncbi:hypothetical protein P8452_58467 [Trifolium repens]|nr:embryo-specific protein ATS3B [Trifolium repens]WJX74864.1 hypothetical protein P8452_58467 [Trifolium repens]
MKDLSLIITFAIIVVFSHATPTLVSRTQPQMNLSFMLNQTQQQINETRLIGGMDGSGDRCNYLITIKTSCDSPTYTNDHISLLFGDALGTELYVPRLDGPDSGPFQKCSTMSFDVPGECIDKICKLYLYRNGTDGWVPETVVAYHNDYPPVIFNYNFFLSDGPGTGFNYCPQP